MEYTDKEIQAFTQIAYADLSAGYDALRMQNPDRTSFSIAELKEASLLAGVKESDLSSLNCLTEDQMQHWMIPERPHDTNASNGFYACIIETAPGEAAVGFRGSEEMDELDSVVNDWVGADAGLVNSTCTNQQAEVRVFLEQYKDQLSGYEHLAMAGHSLGGNLAEYATIVSSEYGLDDNIDQCVSMDGPGFSNEFIHKYRDQIDKMSGIMYHPRWSFVGTMLNDLPGVEYQYVQVSNEANAIDDENYDAFTRHSTKYLVYEDDSLVKGEQDPLSKLTSVISKGVDHLPSCIGNAAITLVCGVWIGFTWAKENFLNDDGSISATGWGIIAGAIGLIAEFGPGTVLATVFAAGAAIVAVLVAAVVTELVYDFVMKVVDAICLAAAKVYNWVEEQYQQFKEAVKSFVDKAKGVFDTILQYATSKITGGPLTGYRDFSQSALDMMVAAARETEEEEWWRIDRWDCWYRLDKAFGGFGMDMQLLSGNVDTYYRKVIDMNDASVADIQAIFEKVYDLDDVYSSRINGSVSTLQSQVRDKLIRISGSVVPNGGGGGSR